MLTRHEILNYEVKASWWAGFLPLGRPWLATIVGAYFAWKARRKWTRYIGSLDVRKWRPYWSHDFPDSLTQPQVSLAWTWPDWIKPGSWIAMDGDGQW